MFADAAECRYLPIVALPLVLSILAAAAAGFTAYGTDPRWIDGGAWGLGLIMLARRLQWPLLALSLVACLTLLAVVISGKRRAWWLIGLLPVLALFVHRFVTGPANRFSVLDEPAMVNAPQAANLGAADYVVGVVLNGHAYAYPYADLYASPVIVQSEREKRMVLMWSARANAATAMEVSRDVKGRDLEVVCDPADSVLIYDSRTGQFIVAITGQTPAGGKMIGAISTLPVIKAPWSDWLSIHPDTKVLSAGGQGPRQPLGAPAAPPGKNAGSYGRLVTIVQSDPPVAIATEHLDTSPLNATLGKTPVVLFRDPQTQSIRAFDRHVESDLVPSFSLAGRKMKNAFMIDSDSGSGWSSAGVAVAGDKSIKGHKLKPVLMQRDVYFGPANHWYHGLLMNPLNSAD